LKDSSASENHPEQEERKSAAELFALLYDELRRLAAQKMARESGEQTLQPTALVHEVWLRLGADRQPLWRSKAQFFSAAAEAMRRILIERARRRIAREKAGLAEREIFAEDSIVLAAPPDQMLAIHESLDDLAQEDSAAADLVKLRYFVGMSMPEAAEALGSSLRNAERIWAFARSWLREALHE
jgi:RNA polymerase sigma factor (TIGR02999 family)